MEIVVAAFGGALRLCFAGKQPSTRNMHGPVLKSSWPSFVPHNKRALGSVCTSIESGDKDRLRHTSKAGDQAAVLLAHLSLLQIFLAAIVSLIPYL